MPIKLSRSEYERIKRLASKEVILSDRDQRRNQLKKKSAAREQKWPNTLAAQRKKKFEARKAREAEEEKRMQALDKEEEDRRNSERRAAIDRANGLLYEQKDQLKKFRSQQLLSDVLAEQAVQREERKLKKEFNKEREAYFHRETMKQIAEGGKIERVGQDARELKAKKIAEEQMTQLKEYTQRHIDDLVQQRIEGQLIVEKAKQDLEAEKRKKAEARRRARQNNIEMKKANENLRQLKIVEEKAAEKELLKMEQYNLDREELMNKRKGHQAKKLAAKQAETQKMIDRAVAHLDSMQSNEEARLERQVEEKRAADDAEQERRDEYRRQQMLAIDRSRQTQLQRKQREGGERIRRDKEVSKQWKAQQKALLEQERREQEDMKMRAQGLQSFIVDQRSEVSQKKAAGKAKALADAKALRKVQRKEDKEFKKMLEKEIGAYAAAGKNTKTMTRSLQKHDEIKGFVFY